MKVALFIAKVAFVGLLWFAGSTYVDLKAEQLAHARTNQSHAHALAVAEKQRADEEAKRRKAEQDLINETVSHEQEVAALRASMLADRASSGAVAERLRNAASEAAARAKRASEVCADPTSAELRKATQDTIVVLTELRERADERAGVLAEFASEAHLAGLACERRYEEARAKVVAY